MPGSGYTTAGAPVQGKTEVVGTISITGYTAGATGEPLAPKDMGLDTVDYVDFFVTAVDGAAMTEANGQRAQWDGSANVYVWDALGEGGTIVEADTSAELRFHALGDTAMVNELLP